MKRVFIDTSAILALFQPRDQAHRQAKDAFDRLQQQQARLLTSSYVLIESYALLGRRLGIEAVQAFREKFAPLLEVLWVEEDLHERGLDLLLARGVRHLSLVDATSFLVIREQEIDEVFAYDGHFEAENFVMV